MATFAAFVVVHSDDGPVMFSPGEAVPEWAEDLVGTHCLTLESDPAAGFTDTEVTPQSDEADADDGALETGTTPDFTGTTPVRRGRPRKQ